VKILVIGSRIPYPLHDGGAIATYSLLQGLAHTGNDVHFFSINTKKHFVSAQTIKEKFGFLSNVVPFYIDTSLNLWQAANSFFTNKSYNISRFFDPQMAEALNAYIAKNTFDTIHFEGLFVSEYAQHLKKNNTPIIYRAHNVEFKIWETLANTHKNILKKWIFSYLAKKIKQFETHIIQYFDAIAAITKNDAVILKSLGYEKMIETICVGIESKTANNQANEIPENVYHIGSMEWMPNQEAMKWFAEKIWPLVVKQNPKAMFYMAGKNMPTGFHAYQNENLKVVGEVADLEEFTKNKSILVVPLLSGSGLRIKTLEGMFAQKAIVSTTTGAIGLDITNENEMLLADNSQAFADCIIKLIDNNLLRNDMAKRGQQFAEKYFGMAQVSAQWQSLYEKIMAKNRL